MRATYTRDNVRATHAPHTRLRARLYCHYLYTPPTPPYGG